MDDVDDLFDMRELHVAMGGSITIAIAKQLIFDRVAHFEATIDALEMLSRHTEHRPVVLEFELEAYFLSLFACLERTTISACEDLQVVSRLAVSYHDIRGHSVFERAVTYLRLFEAIEKLNLGVLDVLRKYHIVRHAVAHGLGVGGLKRDKIQVVLQLPGVVRRGESDDLELSKEFCSRFKEFAYIYIDELERVTTKFGDRARLRVSDNT